MRHRLDRIVLWLFVIDLGISLGAGLYESRVEFPRWANSASASGFDAGAARAANAGMRFWLYVTTVPLTILTLASFVALRWTDPEHYDVVLNTERVTVDECVDEILSLVRSPKFAETEQSRTRLDNLALAARVRAALLKSPETRPIKVAIAANAGIVTLAGCTEDEVLALIEIVMVVAGVRDVTYRARIPEEEQATRD